MTKMRAEIDEIPDAAQRLLDGLSPDLGEIGRSLRERKPGFVVSVARGSSDHAAAFLKYAIELQLGLAVASVGPSIASIYGTRLKLDNALCLSVSQSGQSPDIVALQNAAGQGGALTMSLTNNAGSPLAVGSDIRIDIRAGTEFAVAATKSVVNSILAGLLVVSAWSRDEALERALRQLPEQLSKAVRTNWPSIFSDPQTGQSLYILGRGPALAVAHEAALKCKETCNLHAEAYSAAEVLHGPVSLVGGGFPVLVLTARDAAEASIVSTADKLAGDGAKVYITSEKTMTARRLPFIATGHPLTDALALIVPFYGFVERLARTIGLDPDSPDKLSKVTETT
ncbi:SIS domain-containing protein [Hoeflea prorocentri]|uniref:SIS domain-containing protein n=1 Tax=Hoeflea prorocentri TaxID=1922333 RepID=A0A9X3ZHF8_9HYPH|nr:SIS domain-containing protein [Hoeflea prorocentri]MCY6381299.1 SIS domain-containing protein [Hoeflea prorocentri]MDA5399099.1 SIS domain-containing protein [Hoeflea prorocentri]